MKTKQIVTVLTILSIPLFASVGHAADIICTNSGNWSDPKIWMDRITSNNIVPSTNDSVRIEYPYVVTVDSNAACAYIFSVSPNWPEGGVVIMGAGVTLDVWGDAAGAYGTQQLGLLDATAVGNTVNYHGNAYWAQRTNYYNLVFSGAPSDHYDFYNGDIPGYSGVPMTIAGDVTLIGTNIWVQEGDDIAIGGNLYILGASNKWDCSSFKFTVASNLVLGGFHDLLIDLDGALGTNYVGGNVTVGAAALGWNLTDNTQWAIGGSLTNFGTIVGWTIGYGSISFDGTGVIIGKPFKIPTMTVNGTYTIGTTITLLTNTPTLNGTLVFDLAQAPTNKIIFSSYKLNPLTLYYAGNLNVINSGAAPGLGATYKFFDATNYDGAFTSISLPTLGGSLTWANNLLTSGSFAVINGGGGAPTLSFTNSGSSLTLSWDTTAFPGYSVQAQTNQLGIGTNWVDAGSGGVSPFTVQINRTNPPVFFRLHHP